MPRCHSNPIFRDKAEREQADSRTEEEIQVQQHAHEQQRDGQLLWRNFEIPEPPNAQEQTEVSQVAEAHAEQAPGESNASTNLEKEEKEEKASPGQAELTHRYHVGNGSPRGVRAHGQECGLSDPEEKHFGALRPGNDSSLVPNSESLHSISYCTEHLSKLNPLFYNPECVHSKSSPHHSHGGGATNCTLSIHRASSINYPPTTNSKDSTRNASLAKYNIERGVKSGKLAERWKELCTENHQNPPNLPTLPGVDKAHKGQYNRCIFSSASFILQNSAFPYGENFANSSLDIHFLGDFYSVKHS